MSLGEVLVRLDRRQQEGRWTSFVAAVVKKFGDDQGGQLAALIAYYAFVSLFPLLLVFVTILGFVLEGDPTLQREIRDGTLGQFPIISDQLQLHSLSGSTTALVIGIVVSLLAGLGIMNASQNAFNRIWGVPFKRRPSFLAVRLRGLAMVALLGTLAIASTMVGGFVGSSSHGALAVAGGVLLALAVNLVLFMSAFKVLTATQLSWRDLLPGVVLVSVLWELVEHLGGFYIDHALKRTGPLYGVFALVLGLLAWLYVGAQLTIFAAEVNAVLKRRLWPRSFLSERLTESDKRALTSSAEIEERVESEHVDVTFSSSEETRP